MACKVCHGTHDESKVHCKICRALIYDNQSIDGYGVACGCAKYMYLLFRTAAHAAGYEIVDKDKIDEVTDGNKVG